MVSTTREIMSTYVYVFYIVRANIFRIREQTRRGPANFTSE